MGALISDRRLRISLIGMVVIALVGFATYAGFRLRVTYRTTVDVARLHVQVEELQTQVWFLDKSLDERLNLLETTVFADIQPKVTDVMNKPKTIIREPVWSANRDKEIRDQIRQLQRQLWRLEYER